MVADPIKPEIKNESTFMTERNELCPCGSKIKYKYCFERKLETCTLYAQMQKEKILEQHKEKDDKIFRFFREVLEDIGTIFVTNDKGKELVSSRVQVIAVFTLADIVASYWFAYHDKTGTPTERFITWVNSYCLIPENKAFPNSTYSDISAERLFKLRNSLVHFFGLASGKDEVHNFAISPNNENWMEVTKKLQKTLEKKGQKICVIESKKFYNLVLEGAILMLDEWKLVIDEAQDNEEKKVSHIEGIDRIFQKIETEGALKIQKPEEKLLTQI